MRATLRRVYFAIGCRPRVPQNPCQITRTSVQKRPKWCEAAYSINRHQTRLEQPDGPGNALNWDQSLSPLLPLMNAKL